jgi:hypothetical protein
VKLFPLLATPPTVTTTFPVVAVLGTVALILDDPHVVTDAVTPLNVTLLPPCEDPKLDPLIVTNVPTAPEVGERLEIVGAAAFVGSAVRSARSATNAILNKSLTLDVFIDELLPTALWTWIFQGIVKTADHCG